MRLLLAALCVALTGAPAVAGETGSPRACWSMAEMQALPDEALIRKGIRLSFPGLAERRPAAFSPVPKGERKVIRRVRLPAGEKLVALTFDLCEQAHEIAGYQGGIVDYLRQNRIKATFFAGGKWMLTHRLRAQQLMSDPLFEVGNHGWKHRNLRGLSGKPLADEIGRPQLAYEELHEDLEGRRCLIPGSTSPASRSAADRIGLFRFPYGACNPPSLDAVGAAGLRAIQWDVSSGDPSPGQKADTMARTVIGGVRPGSIVIFHANGRGWHTAEALPVIVSQLKARGYGFVTVSELLARGEPEYSETCYDHRPGDTDRYDTFGISRLAKPPAK